MKRIMILLVAFGLGWIMYSQLERMALKSIEAELYDALDALDGLGGRS